MRTKPLMDNKEQERRLKVSRGQRRSRWQHDKPNGTSWRQLRRAAAFGYAPNVQVKDPEKYLNSHARQMAMLRKMIAARG